MNQKFLGTINKLPLRHSALAGKNAFQALVLDRNACPPSLSENEQNATGWICLFAPLPLSECTPPLLKINQSPVGLSKPATASRPKNALGPRILRTTDLEIQEKLDNTAHWRIFHNFLVSGRYFELSSTVEKCMLTM